MSSVYPAPNLTLKPSLTLIHLRRATVCSPPSHGDAEANPQRDVRTAQGRAGAGVRGLVRCRTICLVRNIFDIQASTRGFWGQASFLACVRCISWPIKAQWFAKSSATAARKRRPAATQVRVAVPEGRVRERVRAVLRLHVQPSQGRDAHPASAVHHHKTQRPLHRCMRMRTLL